MYLIFMVCLVPVQRRNVLVIVTVQFQTWQGKVLSDRNIRLWAQLVCAVPAIRDTPFASAPGLDTPPATSFSPGRPQRRSDWVFESGFRFLLPLHVIAQQHVLVSQVKP